MSLEVNADWWKTLFDEVYLITDARSVDNDELTRKEVDLFCRLIPAKPLDRMLDLCGGQGRHAIELCRRGFSHCTVLDYSHSLLKIGVRAAEKQNCPVAFVRADARNIPHASASYDHVLVLGNSLGYAGDAGNDRRILGEALRLLQPGGWFLVDVTDGHAVREHFSPLAWHEIGADVVVCRQRELRRKVICARELVLNKKTGLVRDRNYCLRLYSADELMGLLADAGFQDPSIHEDPASSRDDGDLGFMNHRLVISARKP